IQFAVLGCINPSGHGLPPFTIQHEKALLKVRAAAQRVGKVISPQEAVCKATPQHLRDGLHRADILFFFGHGGHDRLYFAKTQSEPTGVLTHDDIISMSNVYCRMAILAACNAANSVPSSTARALLRHGVNVIAATGLISADFNSVFFRELYERLLPQRGPTT